MKSMEPKSPPSLAELRKLRKPLKNVNVVHLERLSKNERIALIITRHVGTMWAAYLFGALTLVSLPAAIASQNSLVIVAWIAQTFLQLVLLPIIIVGQNLQGKHSEARAEADFEVNTKAEREIETILQHLEYQNDLILQILRKVEGK